MLCLSLLAELQKTTYKMIDVYDYSNHIECGESDGSFSIRMHYSPNLSKPSNLKCAARTTNAQKVTWNKVAGVTGYQVQCSDGGSKWAQNKVTSGNAAVFGGLVAGGKYKFCCMEIVLPLSR